MLKQIAMLLTNPFRPDPRVLKEARSLSRAGYKVTIICWDREGELPSHETLDGFTIQRIIVKSEYSAGSRQILYLPRFWKAALNALEILKPDIIHCHDLDTTPVGYWYAHAHHIPWIFDAHECYPEQMKAQVNSPIYYLLLALERLIVSKSSHVITVGQLLAQRFRDLGGVVSIVGNYAYLSQVETSLTISRSDLGIPSEDLLIVYIGGFTKGRSILPLVHATAKISEVTAVLIGDGIQQQAIESALSTHPHTIYIGHIPTEQVPAYTNFADVIYYGLKEQNGNNQYSVPNALFNALVAGKPILTTNIGEIAQIVHENNCGIVLNNTNVNTFTTAIEQLKSNTLRQKMTTNAFNLAQTYQWHSAEQILLNVYTTLLYSYNSTVPLPK